MSARQKPLVRCGHYEQVKVRGKWKCLACGQILTIRESIQNSVELSEVMSSSIASRRPLDESLDDVLGRKEWDEILARIPTRRKSARRRGKERPNNRFRDAV